MSSYFVAQVRVYDRGQYEKYLEGFDDIFSRFAGEVVAVDEQPTILEGTWSYSRFVLIRFPSEADLLQWYQSPEYRKLAEIRQAGSTADILLVPGRD